MKQTTEKSSRIPIFFLWIICMVMCEQSLSKQFRVPGQELWGTWRVDSYDFSEEEQPLSFQRRNELAFSREFQPVGQTISIEDDGNYLTKQSARLLRNDPKPHVTVSILPPYSDALCQYERWEIFCKQGKIDQTEVAAPYSANGSASVHWKVSSQKHRRKWLKASPIAYELIGERFDIQARLLDKDTLLVVLGNDLNSPASQSASSVYAIWKRSAGTSGSIGKK